jgi:hypothetical protein
VRVKFDFQKTQQDRKLGKEKMKEKMQERERAAKNTVRYRIARRIARRRTIRSGTIKKTRGRAGNISQT